MGLQHIPKIPRPCKVHDLSALGLCQNLLQTQLHDLLCIPYAERQYYYRGTERIDDAGLSEFQSFPRWSIEEAQLGRTPFTANQLYFVYQHQHSLLQRAMDRGHSRLTSMGDGESSPLQQLYQHARRLVEAQPDPSTILRLLRHIWADVKQGDLLDFCGYRGRGYVYVVEVDAACAMEPDVQVVKVVKTQGPFGCHLPVEAWSHVDVFGVEFFEAAKVTGCLLPARTRVYLHSSEKTIVTVRNGSHLLQWQKGETEESADVLTIHHQVYEGALLTT